MKNSRLIRPTSLLMLVMLPLLVLAANSALRPMTWASSSSDTDNGIWASSSSDVTAGYWAFLDPTVEGNDTNNNDIPDDWDALYEGQARDDDGLSDLEEYQNLTDPTKADTDGDGATDGEEVDAGTDPLDSEDTPRKSSSILKILPLLLNE